MKFISSSYDTINLKTIKTAIYQNTSLDCSRHDLYVLQNNKQCNHAIFIWHFENGCFRDRMAPSFLRNRLQGYKKIKIYSQWKCIITDACWEILAADLRLKGSMVWSRAQHLSTYNTLRIWNRIIPGLYGSIFFKKRRFFSSFRRYRHHLFKRRGRHMYKEMFINFLILFQRKYRLSISKKLYYVFWQCGALACFQTYERWITE